MGSSFLEVKGISKSFGGVRALQNVDLKIESGEIYCLMGENGSGKSTLIKIISGVYTPDEGEMILNGKHYRKITPAESIREGIQIIYQDFSVFPNLSVSENIALSAMANDKDKIISKKKMDRIAISALERISVSLPLERPVEELSVAGKQIVAIARGIAQDAKLLVMDEPTTALTHKEIEALYKIVGTLKQKGIAVIFVSHKLEEVFQISERIAILRNGKKVLDDKTENFDKNSLAYHMTGREIPSIPYEYIKDEAQTVPVMEVKNLSMGNAFENISFCLYSREILGITGQLGCGRTELAKALFGIGKYTGSIWVEGRKADIKNILDTKKYGIGYVPEDRLSEGLFLVKPLTDNITVSSMDSYGSRVCCGRKELTQAAGGWLSSLSIAAENPEVLASDLSGGNQQRIVLAKWLATNPKILILNCPTVGVDIGSKNQIHEIIKDLARQGIGIIVISDDISEILTVCNRILLMRSGKIAKEIESKDTTVEELEEDLIRAE
ncbi:MAG: sugar ABC transporter ATP-binding protein [Lachnospiraceae bacterium]|nr:sugar ABC transporter ATP-binding protein [Lachnospiraceae bacterium]